MNFKMISHQDEDENEIGEDGGGARGYKDGK